MKNGCPDPLEELGAVIIFDSCGTKRYDCKKLVGTAIRELWNPVIEIHKNGYWSLDGKRSLAYEATPTISPYLTKAIFEVIDFYAGDPSDGSIGEACFSWGESVDNALRLAGIYKIKDLLAMSKDDILSLRNVGPKKLDTILRAVHGRGMKFDWE